MTIRKKLTRNAKRSTPRRDPSFKAPMPPGVARVATFAQKSASGLSPILAERAVGVFHKEDGTWEIADNFERFSDLILDFKDGQWTARGMYSEYKKKISQQEAEANAKLMFTDMSDDESRDPRHRRDPSTSKTTSKKKHHRKHHVFLVYLFENEFSFSKIGTVSLPLSARPYEVESVLSAIGVYAPRGVDVLSWRGKIGHIFDANGVEMVRLIRKDTVRSKR